MNQPYSGKQIADAVFGYGAWTFKSDEPFNLWRGLENLREMNFDAKQISDFRLALQLCGARKLEKEPGHNQRRQYSDIDVYSNRNFQIDPTQPNGYRSDYQGELKRKAQSAFLGTQEFKRELHESLALYLGGENKHYTPLGGIEEAPAVPRSRTPVLIKRNKLANSALEL